MRKYAWLKEPQKTADDQMIWKIMLYQTEEGTYLYTYSSPDAVMASSDRWYASTEAVYDEWNDLIDEQGWVEIDDPLPDCQHDAFLPIRVKGRNIGKPEWGHYELLNDGRWVDFESE